MSTLKTIVKLAMPTCFVIGVVVGTLYLRGRYASWAPAYFVATGILVPPIIYVGADTYNNARVQGKSEQTVRSFLRFSVRLFWRHVLLASFLWTMVFLAWLVVGITAVSVMDRNKLSSTAENDGSETEKFFGFMNGVTAPIQLAWSGLVLLWQACMLLAVICFEQASKWVSAHVFLSIAVAIVLYLAWLFSHVRELWSEEFCSPN